MTQTLLLELLTEELPPKILKKLGELFVNNIFYHLKLLNFLDHSSQVTLYATPRRLAVSINNVYKISKNVLIRQKILPVNIALDTQGHPTVLLTNKLIALATYLNIDFISLNQLERAQDGKFESFFYTYESKKNTLQNALQYSLEKAISALPTNKFMSYQRQTKDVIDNYNTIYFIRPVHRLLALYGNIIIPLKILGLDAGNITQGHRFLSHGNIIINSSKDYVNSLINTGKVIPCFNKRKEKIQQELFKQAGTSKILMPEELLDEVTALVEWPAVYSCQFDNQFLIIPQECLILTMQTYQKYFALINTDGKLCSRFLIVSNIETNNPQYIIEGNQRVMQARLFDAQFFFQQDQKKSLIERVPELANVVYHNKLGNQLQRTERIKNLAYTIAMLFYNNDDSNTITLVERSALLSKTDLLTNMVREFPELQGIMGMHYARHDGEPEEIALALNEHYQPRFAGDTLPVSHVGIIIALADKLEALIGISGVDLQFSSDQDPFSLRRYALGILRILIEKCLPLSIPILIKKTTVLFANNCYFKDPTVYVTTFLHERLFSLLHQYGYKKNNIDAVLSKQPEMLNHLIKKLNAIQNFSKLQELKTLVAINKRIINILKKNDSDIIIGTVKCDLLEENAEKVLYLKMLKIKHQVDAAYKEVNLYEAFKQLIQLHQYIDNFFKNVMINVQDIQLRTNRKSLLNELYKMFNKMIDISKLIE